MNGPIRVVFATVGSAVLALMPGCVQARATRATRCRRRPYRCPARISRWPTSWSTAMTSKFLALILVCAILQGSASANRPAPKLELPAIDGTTIRLSDLRGKVVLVDFWASWCSLQSVVPGAGWSLSRAPRSRSRSAGRQRRRTAARRGRVSRRAITGDDGRVRSAGRDAVGLQRSRHAELRGDRSRRQHPLHARGLLEQDTRKLPSRDCDAPGGVMAIRMHFHPVALRLGDGRARSGQAGAAPGRALPQR
jgi:AhpC/TSA family